MGTYNTCGLSEGRAGAAQDAGLSLALALETHLSLLR